MESSFCHVSTAQSFHLPIWLVCGSAYCAQLWSATHVIYTETTYLHVHVHDCSGIHYNVLNCHTSGIIADGTVLASRANEKQKRGETSCSDIKYGDLMEPWKTQCLVGPLSLQNNTFPTLMISHHCFIARLVACLGFVVWSGRSRHWHHCLRHLPRRATAQVILASST